MRLRTIALVMLVLTGAALGAAATGGFVAKAPAEEPRTRPSPVMKHYDPLP